MMAVGVASPSAQGQAITRTVTSATVAYTTTGDGPSTHHTRKATMATAITMGTNTPATLSARRCAGALVPCASSTRRTICASAVSVPTAFASNVNEPVVLMVPPNTSSPGCLATGIGSPVSIASLTLDSPSMTTPSTGSVSPGRTNTLSPTSTNSTATSTSWPPRCTVAVLGRSARRRRMAWEVCPLARASSSRPRRMSAMMAFTPS
jgi:hypothetical protein